MNCSYSPFVCVLIAPYPSVCQHLYACASHLIRYLCECVPPLSCLSPPTVCVGVCPVCMHVFAVWLYKPGESRELSEGGCPGFLSKKDEHLMHNPRCNLLDCSREKITIRKSSQTSEIHHQSQTKQLWSDNTETNQHLCLFFSLLCSFTIKQTMWLFSPHLMGSNHCDKGIKTLSYTHLSFLEAVCLLCSRLNSLRQLMDLAYPAHSLLGLR